MTHYLRMMILGLLLNLILASGTFADTYVMPKELVQHAEKNDCSQVNEFFNRPGMLNPPYVYGYLSGEEENSAVFWCQKRIADDKPHVLLVFMKGPPDSRSTCPQEIEWWNQPGGLSLYLEKSANLGMFKYLRDPQRSGPSNVRLTHKGIMSSYDGVSTMFYCHKGEWFFRLTH